MSSSSTETNLIDIIFNANRIAQMFIAVCIGYMVYRIISQYFNSIQNQGAVHDGSPITPPNAVDDTIEETINNEQLTQNERKQTISDQNKDDDKQKGENVLPSIIDEPEELKDNSNTLNDDNYNNKPEGTPNAKITDDIDDDIELNDVNEQKMIVIDNGSETIKAGLCPTNTNKPHKIFPSSIGTPKQNNTGFDDIYIGDEIIKYRPILDIQNIINRGNVINWDLMEKLWDYTLYDKLNISNDNISDYNICLTETVLRKKIEREKSAEVMFETYNINSLYLQNEAVLSMYATGRTTGCVLGIGYGVTYVASIFEGFSIPNSILRVNAAGYDLTEHLRNMLSMKYPNELMNVKHSVIKDIKEKYCYAIDKDINNGNNDTTYSLPNGKKINVSLHKDNINCCSQLFNGFSGLNDLKIEQNNKNNPLFNNNNFGIHNMVNKSILSVPDTDIYDEMYENIILSGGSTMFNGLDIQLRNKLLSLVNNKTVNIISNDNRQYLAWIGGSIISSINNFIDNSFIKKQEYDDSGPSIVHRKCV